jgi:hypothetical protein
MIEGAAIISEKLWVTPSFSQRRSPLTSNPASGDRTRASRVETGATIAAATMGTETRQSWGRGSVTTQQRGEMHRRGCGATPNPNVNCWTTFAKVFAAPVCSEGTSANAGELRALNCRKRVGPLANRTIAITV